MPVINQVAAADTYPATQAVIQNVYRPKGGWFSVGSFPAFVQLQYALPGTRSGLGNNEWKDEELVGAGAFGFIPADAIGIRFRNANAGSNAVITASLSQGPEPALAIVALGNVTTSGRAPTRTVITAVGAGTYNSPASAVALLVECIGGGGAGGGCDATSAAQLSAGGGGGGGAYGAKLIGSPASSYAIVVGAGGVGALDAAGGNGGQTSFDVVTAPGGGGGGKGVAAAPPATGAQGGAGGVVGVADVAMAGDAGDGSILLTVSGNLLSGKGGSAACGGGGGISLRNLAGAGHVGGNYGGGGSGGANGASAGGGQLGANGAQGVIIVTEFY